ncbi:MAG: hypothetical protein HC837_13395 [Chloroflexaceae bacterium]|nr:hypothetical protein [Chloroflexaceae bacterium]
MSDRVTFNQLRQQRQKIGKRETQRMVQAYLFDMWALIKEARITLIGFSLLTTINTLYLMTLYNPGCTIDERPCLQFLEAIFETIRFYVFEINLPWPSGDLLGQLLWFITPVLGVALIFQGILNFGRYLFDKASRTEAWQVSLAHTYQDHVIVCGLGRIGYRVMMQLLQAGYDVVVVDINRESKFLTQALNLRVPVIYGDARDPDILEQAGVPRTRAGYHRR